jgi:hypothetical protein
LYFFQICLLVYYLMKTCRSLQQFVYIYFSCRYWALTPQSLSSDFEINTVSNFKNVFFILIVIHPKLFPIDLSFLIYWIKKKAKWQVSDTGSTHWASSSVLPCLWCQHQFSFILYFSFTMPVTSTMSNTHFVW